MNPLNPLNPLSHITHWIRLGRVVRLLPAVWVCGVCWGPVAARAEVIAELTSAYHHIQVIDQGGIRTLSFDGSMESRMSLADPARGHFEYTEYFHMPWLWHSNIGSVLMVGLGGASTQRAYARDYPGVSVDTVELDPLVVTLARQYFHYETTGLQRVHESDGRVYLKRTKQQYDVILMDAYSHNRYGSFLPHHLATKEFFELAAGRLGPDGVICYNVMGALQGGQSRLVGAVYNTMKSVFPQVVLFGAVESRNVILLGTRQPERLGSNELRQRAIQLRREGRLKLPALDARLKNFRDLPPPSSVGAPVLTDDFAPVDSLLQVQRLDGAGGKPNPNPQAKPE